MNTIPKVGDRYVDTRDPLNYQFCVKRTRNNESIFVWSDQGATPIEYCRIIEFNLQEAIEICNACTTKEQGAAIRDLLARMKLHPNEKKALWQKLTQEKRSLLS